MFTVVFGLFVLAIAVLCVLIVRWAIKRDLAARRSPRDDASHPGGELSE